MKFTLSQCITYINQALNYPALTYEDINSFFDMAITDLNVTLHTSLPIVSEMIDEYRQIKATTIDNRVKLNKDIETGSEILSLSTTEVDALELKPKFYYDTTLKLYGILLDSAYNYYPKLYGVQIDSNGFPLYLVALNYSNSGAIWALDSEDDPLELNLLEYLPVDWIILYLIPYVCFKYSARDGGIGGTFIDEYTQGFQQLQDMYNVPEHVILATYGDKLAYKNQVLEHLPNLNIQVPTRAIFSDMKHDRRVEAVYETPFDIGGR